MNVYYLHNNVAISATLTLNHQFYYKKSIKCSFLNYFINYKYYYEYNYKISNRIHLKKQL